MKFAAFIDKFTITKLAKRVGVTRRQVYRWKSGEMIPGAETMVRINKLSKGQVTYGDMIHHYLDNQ